MGHREVEEVISGHLVVGTLEEEIWNLRLKWHLDVTRGSQVQTDRQELAPPPDIASRTRAEADRRHWRRSPEAVSGSDMQLNMSTSRQPMQ